MTKLYFDRNDELVAEETALKDPHKYHAVDFDCSGGSDEILMAEGEKTAKAEMFIKKIKLTKQKHFDDAMDDVSEESACRAKEELMDISKFEQAKDHLFFDFFSIYAKNFICQKQDAKPRSPKNYFILEQ